MSDASVFDRSNKVDRVWLPLSLAVNSAIAKSEAPDIDVFFYTSQTQTEADTFARQNFLRLVMVSLSMRKLLLRDTRNRKELTVGDD